MPDGYDTDCCPCYNALVVIQKFYRYISLSILGMIGLSIYILADTFFVAFGIGVDGLSALNYALPFYSVLHGTGLMIGIGAGNYFAIFRSKGQRQAGLFAFSQALKLGTFFSIIYVLFGLFGARPLMSLFTHDPTILHMSEIYLSTLFYFAPAFLFNNILMCFVRNNGSPGIAMGAMLIGSFVNIVLDWVFIFPLQMGIFGAILATVMAPMLGIAVSLLYLFKFKQFRIVSAKRIEPNQSISKHQILKTGIPSLVSEMSSGVVILLFNAVILNLADDVGVAAYGVIANVYLVVVALFNGIAQGAQPLLSHYYGLKDRHALKTLFKCGLITIVILSGLIYAFTYFQADALTAAFNREQNPFLQQMASEGFPLYFLVCPFAGLNIFFCMYLVSSHATKKAQLISLLRGLLVIIPMTLILAQLFQIRGVWLSPAMNEGLVCIVAAIMIHQIFKPDSPQTKRQPR